MELSEALLERSLPLMGIGNGRVLDHGPVHRRTHYPSWGLETRPLGESDPATHSHELITPHGDWKPDSVGAWLLLQLAPTSLPLMGIGNFGTKPVLSSSMAGAHISLPLMGIGNGRSGHSLLAESLICSLPLMGIGNASMPGTVATAPTGLVKDLITPHGDWKQPSTLRYCQQAGECLITPHGDWKLDYHASSTWTITIRGSSLPLMGIGNGTASPTDHHGRAPPSHYPSWGLETLQTPIIYNLAAPSGTR